MANSLNVLVAGGAGYIGSHAAKALKAAGHNPVLYDNLYRGHREVAQILNVPGIWADLHNSETLTKALRDHRIDAVMHFAAYAYVGESVQQPLSYYDNNVAATINLLKCMKQVGVGNIVFSSTCATYGDPDRVPLTEKEKQAPVSPYGRSKLAVEWILRDQLVADRSFSFASLRYFNASGCAMDGTLGEDHAPETHLIPLILQAIQGTKPPLTLFGTDYPTPDGTNVRDYIHVDDLASAHILAMERLAPGKSLFLNLGTGAGFSVKEIIAAAEKVTGRKVPHVFGPRRPGDANALWADPSAAREQIGWEANYKDPEAIIASAWKWFEAHPKGYSI